jgi:hypothetical protein
MYGKKVNRYNPKLFDLLIKNGIVTGFYCDKTETHSGCVSDPLNVTPERVNFALLTEDVI